MNSRPPNISRLSAFTLIELLTVIAIIAILMGLLFPALGVVRDQANKVRAKTDIMGAVAAVKQYYTEYGKYPLTATGVTNADVTFGDTATSGAQGTVYSNENLFEALRNYPNGNRTMGGTSDGNPRQIVFFEGKAGTSANNANPRGGFGTSTNTAGGTGKAGAFYDPWGNQYAVAVDGTYDNFSPVPYLDFPAPTGGTQLPTTCVNAGCAAWSVGKDGKIGNKGDSYLKNNGTPSDDVVSWQ